MIKKLLLFLIFLIPIVLVLATTAPTITVVLPVNDTVYSYRPGLNISTSVNSQWCAYTVNETAPIRMTNGTGTGNTTWVNSSALAWADTSYGTSYDDYYNVSFTCTNASDVVWSNTSTTAGVLYFKIDTTYPQMSFEDKNYTTKSGSVSTSGGTTWDFAFNFTDNSYDKCGLRYYKAPLTSTTPEILNGTYSGMTDGYASNASCNIDFDPETDLKSSLLVDGKFILEGWGSDLGNHYNYTTTNITGVMTKLYTGYNFLTFTGANATHENETVGQFVSNHFASGTIVSVWSNVYGNYTTYSSSVPTTNNDTVLYPGLGIYVYTASNKYLISPEYLPDSGDSTENVTLWLNDSVKSTPWNQMGLLSNTTINSTFYACTHNGTVGVYNSDECPPILLNVTRISWFNESSGLYISCKRGFTVCAGGAKPSEVVLPEGSAVWVLTDANITLNRTGII